MSHSKLVSDDPPFGGENEEFIAAYHQQEASRAGKIRNMERRWNNNQSGRANVKSAKELTPFDIALIHTAKRSEGKKLTILKIEKLTKGNQRTAQNRRCEAFKILKSWVKSEIPLKYNSAELLLRTDNVCATERLGLKEIAKKVKDEIESQNRAADAVFSAPSEADHFADDPIPSSFDGENSRTPPPSPTQPEAPPLDRSYGIHRSMIDFHMPFSQVKKMSYISF